MPELNASNLAARKVLEAFDSFNDAFRGITRRARDRFEHRDWQGARRDAVERLDLYELALDRVATQLDTLLGECAKVPSTWVCAKDQFRSLITSRYDLDRAETFFNSVTRRMLSTIGINREVEFFYLHPKRARPELVESVFRSYPRTGDTNQLVRAILEDACWSIGYEDIDRDASRAAQEIELHLWPVVREGGTYSIDVVKSVFFRNKGAYIVGRIVVDGQYSPLIIPLVNGDHGLYVDTVLLREADACVVFSFAYSYFQVDVERYDALIHFLQSMMPSVQLAELYTSLGYNRHGKTEFYRELHRFVHVSKEQFVIAPGREGSVMMVFTLPDFDFVFKVIKDHPCYLRAGAETPKAVTRREVMHRYDFVSHRDRAGRMVDTQEFENLRFKRKRFTVELLREFMLAGKESVTLTDEYVILRHLYVQRKVIPLPMYFQGEKNTEMIRHVLVDFGYFLKELAASGVFPTDLFNIWNYGVTHWGRVVLFDYDDVVPLERIRFREKPSPRNVIEEMEPEENWIVATEDDFFMEEIDLYSGIPHPLKGAFKAVHGDLYTLEFWEELTGRLARREVFDVFPYDRSKRFRELGRPV